jgi:hypothetical protein
MAAARPRQMPAAGQKRRRAESMARGSPSFAEVPAFLASSGGPGAAPRARVLSARTALKGVLPQAGNGTPPAFPTVSNGAFVYTRYRLFPDATIIRNRPPYRAIGKLFYSVPGAGDFTCSAAVVSSANLSVVWTAGHCLATPGLGFHSDFVFVPAFHEHGAAVNLPYGVWTASVAATLVGWLQQGLYEYDVGALAVTTGGIADTRVGDAVGFLGFAANLPRRQHWHAVGYPAERQEPPSPGPIFDGGHQELCAASFAANDQPTGVVGVDPPTVGMGCDQSGGSSGGPWIVDMSGSTGFTNLINGNSSYRYLGCTVREACNLELYSPYYGVGALNLLQFAEQIAP